MKGVKCIKRLFYLALFICAFVFINPSKNASAASITSGIYSTAIYTKNFQSTDTVYNQGPINTGGTGVINVLTENNPTGIWDYTQALSFPNPFSNKVGTGYQSTLYFTMHSVDGPYLNPFIKQMMASNNLGFEGLSEDLPYCTQVWDANIQDDSTVQFILRSSCPYGTYPANTSFDQVEANINFKPESIFWCANDNSTRMCPTSFRVTLYNIDYYFGVLTTSEDSYNQTIINQNQTIINNQNQINDYLTDNTPPSADTSVISGSAGWLPPGPVDSLLTLPITLAQGILDVFTGTHQCSPISLPLSLGPYSFNLDIPCLDSYFSLASVNIIWNAVGVIISAFIIYSTLKWLYTFVDDTLTFRENNSGMWGGL